LKIKEAAKKFDLFISKRKGECDLYVSLCGQGQLILITFTGRNRRKVFFYDIICHVTRKHIQYIGSGIQSQM